MAGWLRSACGVARWPKRLAATPMRSAQAQNFDCGSCAALRAGWSEIKSSNTICRAVFARSEDAFTFMPGDGVRMQLAASTRSPSTSTMQARQLPSAR